MEALDVWPLEGRDQELSVLDEALSGPVTRGIVLLGEAGVGKSRLLREAVSRMSNKERPCEWITATRAAAAIPLAAISHVFRGCAQPGQTPLGLLIAAADRLREQGPTLVAIDDAHLLDESSSALLHQLALSGLIVPAATVRDDSAFADTYLELSNHMERIWVRPLPVTAMDRLIEHALGPRVNPISRRHLRSLTNGNPLVLRELIADAVDSGALVRHAGVWTYRRIPPSGPRLSKLVQARIQALEPEAMAVVEAVACGEPLELDVLQRLAGPEAIEAAERSGIVVADRSRTRPRVRLRHPLYAEVIRAHVPVSRAQAIFTTLARAIVCDGEGVNDLADAAADDVMRAGIWEVESGNVLRPEVVKAAVELAIARFDLPLAERLARAASENAPDWENHWILSRVLQLRGRAHDAFEAFPPEPGVGSERWTRWALTRSTLYYWGLGKAKEAELLLCQVPATAHGSELARASRSWIQLFDGRCDEALDVARDVLADPGAQLTARVWAAMSGTIAAGLLGAGRQAGAMTKVSTGLLDHPGQLSPWEGAQLGYGLTHLLLATGRPREAAALADASYVEAIGHEAHSMAGMWAGLRGVIAKAQGRMHDADLHLHEAIALLVDHDEYQNTRVCMAELAGLAALKGETGEAQAWMRGADARRTGCNRLYDPWVELNRAWVLASEGRLTKAADQAMRAAGLARETRQPTFECTALYTAARLGAPRQALARLNTLAAKLDLAHPSVQARAAEALHGGDGRGLERAADAFHASGHFLHAAEAANAAAGAYRRQGNLNQAVVALEKAATFGAECVSATTPLLTRGDGSAVLTRREREIALLAARMPSKAIAAELDISVYTVNNTLSRVFGKLGIAGRGELASSLGLDP